jgi:hypothetical protein
MGKLNNSKEGAASAAPNPDKQVKKPRKSKE